MTEQEQLEKVSMKVDELLLSLLKEHEMSPLNVSAVVLGRVFMLNDSAGTTEEFKRLLDHVLEIQPTDYLTKPTIQ